VQSERLSLYAAACEQLIRVRGCALVSAGKHAEARDQDGHAYRDFQPEAATLAEKEAERKTKKKTPRPNRDAIVPDEEEAQRLIAEGRPFVVRFRVSLLRRKTAKPAAEAAHRCRASPRRYKTWSMDRSPCPSRMPTTQSLSSRTAGRPTTWPMSWMTTPCG
jgi:hypothetical protein